MHLNNFIKFYVWLYKSFQFPNALLHFNGSQNTFIQFEMVQLTNWHGIVVVCA